MVGLEAMVMQCAPLIEPSTAHALIHVESGGNPFAIGVVGGRLERQPRNKAEALATVASLEAGGMNYSVGLGQINQANFKRLGLTAEAAFEPCKNLQALQSILGECFDRASQRDDEQRALRKAFSCYYSGNFQTGFHHGYVDKVIAAARSRTGRGKGDGATN